MVFIDASHAYEDVKEDIAWASKLEIPVIAVMTIANCTKESYGLLMKGLNAISKSGGQFGVIVLVRIYHSARSR